MCVSDIGIMELRGMVFHAYHGCLEREKLYGNTFRVDFKAEYPLRDASLSDDLADAADYSAIYRVIEREMAVRADLLESLARRIADAIRAEIGDALGPFELSVSKHNPPVGGKCEWATITVRDIPENASAQ